MRIKITSDLFSDFIELLEFAFSVGTSECASSTAAKKIRLNERETTFSEDSIPISERFMLGAALHGIVPATDNFHLNFESSGTDSEASVPRMEAKHPDRSSGWIAFEPSKRSLESLDIESQSEIVAPDAARSKPVNATVSAGSLDSVSIIPPYQSVTDSYWADGKYIKNVPYLSRVGCQRISTLWIRCRTVVDTYDVSRARNNNSIQAYQP